MRRSLARRTGAGPISAGSLADALPPKPEISRAVCRKHVWTREHTSRQCRVCGVTEDLQVDRYGAASRIGN
ncbi:MAG: hypothetical protein WA117_11675 [Verrucomicrobiia bacterium]